jgi:hypothetical protein
MKITLLALGLACFPTMDFDKILNGDDLTTKAPYTLVSEDVRAYELPTDYEGPDAVVWGTIVANSVEG